MTFEDQAAREARAAEERRVNKLLSAQFRKDVQTVFALPEARRLLHGFLHTSGVDASALRHDGLTTGHAIGWQDAAGWWLNALRSHCPEKEVQMRAEAKREAAQGASQDEGDD